ncbi:MAG: hypothetical protein EBU84_21670 [Actinobacteria bacterium]|nr:hypothetical protein [Actinomycetota bacterium]
MTRTITGTKRFEINAIIRTIGGRADSREGLERVELAGLPLETAEAGERGGPSDELPGRDGGKFPLNKSPNWYE